MLALIGPTASGKTGLAIALAHRFYGEIISIDSALVYRGMDTGTAKPSLHERQGIPHHLVDIIDPDETYSAARFCEDCLHLIDEIHARGKVPVLAGGTMMYFNALREGLDELPPSDPRSRKAVALLAAHSTWPQLHAHLATIDPDSARRIGPNDSQRIGRALEIHFTTGRTMTELLGRRGGTAAGGNAGTGDGTGGAVAGSGGGTGVARLPFDLFTVSLEPSDRAELHRRIALRFDTMLRRGLLDELKWLREEYRHLHSELPSMRCVGYRQAWMHLEGFIDHAAMREQGIAATRQLAKRQITWLRSMEALTRVDCLRPDLENCVMTLTQSFLEGNTV